jgi:DNA-binding MarR family transcriptional regulator
VKNNYLNYLELRDELRSNSIDLELDLSEIKILETIAVLNHNGMELTVTDLINKKELGSNSTLHKKLYKLITLEYIELYHQSNYRTKYLKPTEKSVKYFENEFDVLKKFCKKQK